MKLKFILFLLIINFYLLRTNMSKIMITCFKHNSVAQFFFKEKLKYQLYNDEL
jgi:hypothetical protein